jgi:hypothetical protein
MFYLSVEVQKYISGAFKVLRKRFESFECANPSFKKIDIS